MKKVLLAAAAVACFGTVAMAGPNAGGTLIVVSDGVIYCGDNAPYCGTNSAVDCESGNVNLQGPDQYVLNVLAAFSSAASPRVSGVVFGIAYNSAEVFLVDGAGCGDFELPDATWPTSGAGTAVTWNAAQTAQVNDVYWFAAYNYYGNPNSFELTSHPTQGSDFADDSVPAELDPIAGLGAIGFDGGFSNLPCPAGEVPGACCDAAGDCTIVLEAECGGEFLGGPCDPNPCPQPATGACCASDQSCATRTADECAADGGDYRGDDVPCDPNPCVIPVVESTWGEIKNSYR